MLALRRLITRSFATCAVAVGAMTLAPSLCSAQATFDHAAFDALLHAHVRNGMVDYDAFAASPAFAAYLGRLAAFDPASLSPSDQIAFWIDAYNAYTIQLVTAHHERESIRNINKSFGFIKGHGPWTEQIAVVGGKSYGLDDIEQDILRKRYHEPRIHVALVCAAMGCPPLRSEAYVGSRLDAQLDDQARIFVLQSPSKNRVDVATRSGITSTISVALPPRSENSSRDTTRPALSATCWRADSFVSRRRRTIGRSTVRPTLAAQLRARGPIRLA
jgi:hypothetical protein